VGDLVFLKIQPYVQSLMAPWSNQTPTFKYFGPFPMVQKIGTVAYKLDLPSHASIHLVFHVSQLKKAVGSELQVSPLLSPELSAMQVHERIIQRRVVNRGTCTVMQALIKWSGVPKSLATWEDIEPLRQGFPGAAAWGQEANYGGGDVTPCLQLEREIKLKKEFTPRLWPIAQV
jgi:hypothetical protein